MTPQEMRDMVAIMPLMEVRQLRDIVQDEAQNRACTSTLTYAGRTTFAQCLLEKHAEGTDHTAIVSTTRDGHVSQIVESTVTWRTE